MKTCAKTRKIVPLVLALLLLFSGCSAVNRAAVFGTNGNETARRQDVLTVEFLDVGQANAALLTCGGKSLLIDGGNVADGAKVTRAVQAATDRLDYVVNTHGHEDHVGGLAAVVDAVPVGHHGSDSATGYVFLRQALPKYAVISVGAGNRYGHPAESTLSRLRDAGCTVYRTDQSGTITVVTDKNGKIRCPA